MYCKRLRKLWLALSKVLYSPVPCSTLTSITSFLDRVIRMVPNCYWVATANWTLSNALYAHHISQNQFHRWENWRFQEVKPQVKPSVHNQYVVEQVLLFPRFQIAYWIIFKPTGYQITEQGHQHPSCGVWSIYHCTCVQRTEIPLVWHQSSHTHAVEGGEYSNSAQWSPCESHHNTDPGLSQLWMKHSQLAGHPEEAGGVGGWQEGAGWF